MVTEDYVSFEVAKLLKEKGFDNLCRSYWPDNNFLSFEHTKLFVSNDNNFVYLLRPTIQMAMKWLREVHNLHIQPEITAWPRKGYFVGIYLYKNRHNNFEKVPFAEHKESYEESCEAAIKYCLEKLI